MATATKTRNTQDTAKSALTLFPTDHLVVRRRREWELDPETCEVGLNAIAKLRAILGD